MLTAPEIALAPAGPMETDLLAPLMVELAEAHGFETTLVAAEASLSLLLAAGHRATLMRHGRNVAGACLWIDLGDHVFIRRFVIAGWLRGRGLGRLFFERLSAEVWPPRQELRLEVFAPGPQEFWAGLGFAARSTGMRRPFVTGDA